MGKQDIINKIKENKVFLNKNYSISEIGLFGSVVKGEDTINSDIDIMISFKDKNKISILDFINIKYFFEDLFNKKVDVVDKDMIKNNLRNQILKEAIII